MVLCQCLSVPKGSANKILSYLLKKDLVRKDLKIRDDGEYVYIPVREGTDLKGTTMLVLEFQERDLPISPVESINLKLGEMGIKDRFPEKYTKLGNSLFIKEGRLPRFPKKVFLMAAREFHASAIYLDRGISGSPLREPDATLIWGKGGELTHEENGVLYTFDPTKVMFSPGNVNSRVGESRGEFNGMAVVDMFAGIGYFTLQIAKGSPLAKIYACELNPISFSFLMHNVRKNKMEDRITLLPGDCRSTTMGIKADYILMGHFDSPNFLSTALRISHMGTVINMHLLCDTNSINSHWYRIMESARHLGYALDFLGQNIVKSYGPHLWHVSAKFVVLRML